MLQVAAPHQKGPGLQPQAPPPPGGTRRQAQAVRSWRRSGQPEQRLPAPRRENDDSVERIQRVSSDHQQRIAHR